MTKTNGAALVKILDLGGDFIDVTDFYTDPIGTNWHPGSPALSNTEIYWIMSVGNVYEKRAPRKIFKMPLQGDNEPLQLRTEFDAECLHIHRSAGNCKQFTLAPLGIKALSHECRIGQRMRNE